MATSNVFNPHPTRRGALAATGGVAIGAILAASGSPASATPNVAADIGIDAADYGVVAGTTSDQSPALQDALDAAQAAKAFLLLPSGVIRLDTPLNWTYDLCSVHGQPGTVLDFQNATFTGAAITVKSTHNTNSEFSGNRPPSLTDLAIFGPGAKSHIPITDPQIDGILMSSNDSAKCIYHLQYSNVKLVGFRNQEIIGDNSWLIEHLHCEYGGFSTSAITFNGTTNSGENLSWTNCLFYNSDDGTAFAAGSGGGLDAYFTTCSFDYLGAVADVQSGNLGFNSCHFESSFGEKPWIKLKSATDQRPVNVSILGGEFNTQRNTAEKFVMIDVDSTSTYPVNISATGVNLLNRATSGAPMLFLTNSTGDPKKVRATISGGNVLGALVSVGTGPLGLGTSFSMLVNSDFEANTLGSGIASALLGAGWYAPSASDPNVTTTLTTSVSYSGTRCLQVVHKPSPPNNNPIVASQVISARSGWAYVSAFSRGQDHTSNPPVLQLSFYRDATLTNRISWEDLLIFNSDAAWELRGRAVYVPPGTSVIRADLYIANGSGTLFVDDLVCTLM